MLSKKAKYALKALTFMARNEKELMPVAVIAKASNAPRNFLDNILQELKRNGYVESRRGVQGGYLLARKPDDIQIGDLIRLIDGPLAPVRCASLTAYERCLDCRDEKACAIRKLMLKVRHATADILDNKTLSDMVAE